MRTVIALVSIGLIGGLATLPAAGGPQTPHHQLGIPGCDATHLKGVSLGSATDGWAVGYHFASANQALVLHWNGTRWTRATLPAVGAESYLYAVATFSPTQAFAVGLYRVGEQFRTLVLAWDGQAWSQLPSPSPDDRSNDLYGVSILAPNDAWAVGAYGFVDAKTLALHWDGSSWTRVATPNPTTFDFLQSVDGTATDDVWAVGARDDGTLALHWNGSTWKRVDSFGGEVLDTLFGVSAVDQHDVWGVGVYDSDRALTERWDGAAWGQVKVPGPGTRSTTLNGVDAVTSKDVWAVGTSTRHFIPFGVALHWDGSTWSRFPIQGQRRTLTAVSAVSSADVWAVGARRGSCLIEHWNGAAWTRWLQ